MKVSGKVAGQRAMPALVLALPGGASTPVTVKLSERTARRLRTKGGSLRFSAQTLPSSLPAVSSSVRVKRPKHRP